MLKQRNYQELRRDFTSPPTKYRPVSFIRVDGDFSDEEKMNTILNTVKRAGYGGISPIPVADLRRAREATTPLPGSDAYFDAYEKFLERAKKLDLQVVYYDDVDFPSGSYMGKVLEKYPELKAQMLVMREYECMEGEITRRTLDNYLERGLLDRVYAGGKKAIGVSRESFIRFTTRRVLKKEGLA